MFSSLIENLIEPIAIYLTDLTFQVTHQHSCATLLESNVGSSELKS